MTSKSGPGHHKTPRFARLWREVDNNRNKISNRPHLPNPVRRLMMVGRREWRHPDGGGHTQRRRTTEENRIEYRVLNTPFRGKSRQASMAKRIGRRQLDLLIA